jgi:hypothetical protein
MCLLAHIGRGFNNAIHRKRTSNYIKYILKLTTNRDSSDTLQCDVLTILTVITTISTIKTTTTRRIRKGTVRMASR